MSEEARQQEKRPEDSSGRVELVVRITKPDGSFRDEPCTARIVPPSINVDPANTED